MPKETDPPGNTPTKQLGNKPTRETNPPGNTPSGDTPTKQLGTHPPRTHMYQGRICPRKLTFRGTHPPSNWETNPPGKQTLQGNKPSGETNPPSIWEHTHQGLLPLPLP